MPFLLSSVHNRSLIYTVRFCISPPPNNLPVHSIYGLHLRLSRHYISFLHVLLIGINFLSFSLLLLFPSKHPFKCTRSFLILSNIAAPRKSSTQKFSFLRISFVFPLFYVKPLPFESDRSYTILLRYDTSTSAKTVIYVIDTPYTGEPVRYKQLFSLVKAKGTRRNTKVVTHPSTMREAV